jgi:hypothetical protein
MGDNYRFLKEIGKVYNKIYIPYLINVLNNSKLLSMFKLPGEDEGFIQG